MTNIFYNEIKFLIGPSLPYFFYLYMYKYWDILNDHSPCILKLAFNSYLLQEMLMIRVSTNTDALLLSSKMNGSISLNSSLKQTSNLKQIGLQLTYYHSAINFSLTARCKQMHFHGFQMNHLWEKDIRTHAFSSCISIYSSVFCISLLAICIVPQWRDTAK